MFAHYCCIYSLVQSCVGFSYCICAVAVNFVVKTHLLPIYHVFTLPVI